MEPKIGTVLGALLHGILSHAAKHQPAVPHLRAPSLRASFKPAAALACAFLATLLVSGCGNEYRPVVSSTNPVGPAGQPTKYAVVISNPNFPTPGNLPGLITFVDFAGDTVLDTPQILSNPSYFILGSGGTEGYVINSAGSLNDFPTSSPTSLLTADIFQTTLPVNAGPLNLSALSPSGSSSTIFIPEVATSRIAILNGFSASLLQEVSVPSNPTYVVGADGTPRVYALSAGTGAANGTAAAIEAVSTSSLSVSATIPVGINPTYGVMSTDDRRAFILNKGSGTVSVINVLNNALDSTTPTITLPPIPFAGGVAPPNPVWADLSTVNTEFVVLNQGDGIHPGSLSVISIPLCSLASQPTNPLCNSTNPIDAAGFGTIVSTALVGVSPSMVSVLHDGTRAYVINQSDTHCPAGVGSVSVVNLITGLLSSTICGVANASAVTSDAFLHGHPNSVSATTGLPTGKVYITSGDSKDLTVIYTDTDTVQAHIPLQGSGQRVLVTQP